MTIQASNILPVPPTPVSSASGASTCRPSALRIVLVDDHAVMREGLKSLLCKDPAVAVVGEAADGHMAIRACMQLQPDIVLMDLQLPSLDGVDAIATIRRRWPCIRVVVLSGVPSEIRAAAALRAGAHAYVLKRSKLDQLMAALQAARLGRPYVDPDIKLDRSIAIPKGGCGHGSYQIPVAGLTPRERQILKLIAEGLTNRRIGELLSISLKTVETHRMNLMRKLDAHNAAELSNWARRLGLIDV